MEKRYYIAYGSNLNVRQMRMRCPTARIIGTSDRYEGFPNFYYKKELMLPIKGIRTGKVRKRRVFVYIMHEDRPIGIPSVSYMQTCIQGYDDFGFDRLVLIDAYLKCGEPQVWASLPGASGSFEARQRNAHLPGLRYTGSTRFHRRKAGGAGADHRFHPSLPPAGITLYNTQFFLRMIVYYMPPN